MAQPAFLAFKLCWASAKEDPGMEGCVLVGL